MANETRPLDGGERFPTQTWTVTDGSTITVPANGQWTAVVVYRGNF